jgi:hypothetical protein
MTKNQIIESLFTGKNFNDCLSKMEPAHLREDLKMEVISIVCEWPEEKVIGLYERKELEFYVVRVILNQVKSNTSPFTKKYRKAYCNIFSNNNLHDSTAQAEQNRDLNKKVEQRFDSFQFAAEPTDIKERLIRETLEQITFEEIDKLYWYDAEMIRLYLKLGSFRAIQDHTGIPFISCYKNIQKSLTALKKKAIEKATPIFSKEELSFIQNNKPCRDT